VFAVVTMRTTSGPTPFDHLVKDGHLRRSAVDPLSRESVETLLHRVLGGPLVAESLFRFRDAAMGNPGVLRQLVECALEMGTLAERDGVWRLSGRLQPTQSFEDVVADRLRGLDDVHHHAAELLAVAGEVALDAVATVAGNDVLEDLERRGLLTVRASGRRTNVSLAHPLFAEVLLRLLPALRARRLRRELADAVEAVGARRRDDRMRLVAWRIDGGGDVDPESVLDAARLAVVDGDDAIADRLIKRARSGGAGAQATVLEAELEFRRNEPERLEAVLAGLDLSQLGEADRVRVLRRRSANLYYGLTAHEGALTVLDDAAHLFESEDAKQAIQAHRATILSMAGYIDDALACSEPLLDVSDPRLRFEVLRAHAFALAIAGRGEHALALVVEALGLHDHFDPDLHRPGRSILVFTELFALTELGRIAEGRAAGELAAATDLRGGRAAWLAFSRPRLELLAGDAHAALAHSEPYALETRARGAFGAERWVLALVGMARLLGGDADGGCRDLDRVAELWQENKGLFRSDRDRALGWLAAHRLGPDAAESVFAVGAADAQARGAFALEAMLRYEIVRVGRATTAVADRLAALAAATQGPLPPARADHAAGVVGKDTGRLAAAVAAFEALGSPLLAAEAALDLVDVALSTGDGDAAAAATEAARRLRARLDPAVVTPRLSRASEPAG
jgi:hypothetical protein